MVCEEEKGLEPQDVFPLSQGIHDGAEFSLGWGIVGFSLRGLSSNGSDESSLSVLYLFKDGPHTLAAEVWSDLELGSLLMELWVDTDGSTVETFLQDLEVIVHLLIPFQGLLVLLAVHLAGQDGVVLNEGPVIAREAQKTG